MAAKRAAKKAAKKARKKAAKKGTNKGATARRNNPKGLSAKNVLDSVHCVDGWNIVWGELGRQPGRPRKVQPIFKVVAEKIPFDCIEPVKAKLQEEGVESYGVYMAHDSMGVARYGGRGDVFDRLGSHKKKYPRELVYFSFYIIEDKQHEREIETAILRAAGSQMVLNTNKVRTGIAVGNVADYEPGTRFFERQKQRGKKATAKKKAKKG